jgi:hypothetical protein
MNKQSEHKLHAELRAAGAAPAELPELTRLASTLKQLKAQQPTTKTPTNRWRKLWPAGAAAVLGVSLGMALVILSQTVLPNNPLYRIQQLSDNLTTAADPSYRGTVMMKRAQQVRELIARHASTKVVLATLADYQNEAASYASMPTNYAAFEYCKDNLQQAATAAPAAQRQAIVATLSSLKAV